LHRLSGLSLIITSLNECGRSVSAKPGVIAAVNHILAIPLTRAPIKTGGT
jgi:hypothetical protein